jgi:hypothetical protein
VILNIFFTLLGIETLQNHLNFKNLRILLSGEISLVTKRLIAEKFLTKKNIAPVLILFPSPL